MQIGSAWLYPLTLAAGALQAWGPLMNGALRKSLDNPWLASMVSFLPIIAFLLVLLLCLPTRCRPPRVLSPHMP